MWYLRRWICWYFNHLSRELRCQNSNSWSCFARSCYHLVRSKSWAISRHSCIMSLNFAKKLHRYRTKLDHIEVLKKNFERIDKLLDESRSRKKRKKVFLELMYNNSFDNKAFWDELTIEATFNLDSIVFDNEVEQKAMTQINSRTKQRLRVCFSRIIKIYSISKNDAQILWNVMFRLYSVLYYKSFVFNKFVFWQLTSIVNSFEQNWIILFALQHFFNDEKTNNNVWLCKLLFIDNSQNSRSRKARLDSRTTKRLRRMSKLLKQTLN